MSSMLFSLLYHLYNHNCKSVPLPHFLFGIQLYYLYTHVLCIIRQHYTILCSIA